MELFNLGIGEILFIIIIALIIFGPGNMVKTAREMGAFIRKVTQSPYWQEVWATKRELAELPKIIVKEAQLDQTISELDRQSKGLTGGLSASVTEFIREINQPLEGSQSTVPAQEKQEPTTVAPKIIDVKTVEDKTVESKAE
ncbi:MAG: twin-arginine translocase TatA/TatE family subunit [Anaerolineae bacterium]|nr:twin-arginine translocase TatA/TatE family subunit [Anaerolineae bacterium]